MNISTILDKLSDLSFSLNFASGGLWILVYVLQALALFTIAKRRGIKNPGLAWVPLVNVWILGSISDQYRYVVKGEVKNKRKALLGMEIASAVMAFAVCIAAIVLVVQVVLEFPHFDSFPVTWFLQNHIGTLLLILMLGLALAVLSIVYAVFFWMAMYDLFRSCEPENTTLYMVLSLVGSLVVPGAYAVFLILCREKDLGMPPRKPEPEIPAQPEPIREPWENADE